VAAEIPHAAGFGQRVSAGLPSFSCGAVSGLAADDQVIAFVGGLNPMVLRHRVSQ
jgi:hypothetical protein